GHRDRGSDGESAQGTSRRARRASVRDRVARGGHARRRRGRTCPETGCEGAGMTLKTTVIGAYPKIGEGLDGQELRSALHRHDRGEIGDADLDKVFDEVTRSAIGEIESAGIDVTNDAQIRWDDLLSP